MTNPATPRGDKGATTPRSARRLTTSLVASWATPSRVVNPPAEYPALAPLNTKKYPSVPYADDAEFAELLHQDMDAVDAAVDVLSRMVDERKRLLREHLTDLDSERQQYELKIRELGELAKDNVKTQQRERDELDHAKDEHAKVNRQHDKLRVKLEGYHQEVKELEQRVDARRDLKTRQAAAFELQLGLNKPELDFFERYLGLKIRGKDDIVQFKFVRLDRTSYSRSFSFELDVSTSSYLLSSVSPANYLAPEALEPLVSRLNDRSIDLYEFVRSVRTSFCVEVELERRFGPRSLPPQSSSTTTTTTQSSTAVGTVREGDEAARERERERILKEIESR